MATAVRTPAEPALPATLPPDLAAAVRTLIRAGAAPMTPDEVLCSLGAVSVDEAAAFLGVGRDEVYLELAAGLPSVKWGRRRLIPKRALVALLARKLTESAT